MQLIDLLKRLSPEDLAALGRRRGIETTKVPDLGVLTGQLASRQSLATILCDLDAFQLAVLRWLSTQPGYSASWDTLVDTIGGRVDGEYLIAEIQELRLCGLIDFDPSTGQGFIATYAAVPTALPSRDIRLRDHFAQHDSDSLRRICTYLGLKRPPTTRDARLDLIVNTLADPGLCRAIVHQLPEQSRALFDWVVAEGGRVGLDEAQKRPGGGRAARFAGTYVYHGRYDYSEDPLTLLLRKALLIPLGQYYFTDLAVPREVAAALTDQSPFDATPLVPPPLQAGPAPDSLPAGVVPHPLSLLRDLAHLVGFVGAERCEWRQDGQPYQRSLQALGKVLKNPDRNYADVLWEIAVKARLVRPGRPGGGYTAAGFGKGQPITAFQGLLDSWPGGFLASQRLMGYLLAIPPETWIDKESFQQLLGFMRPELFGSRGSVSTVVGSGGWATLCRLVVAEVVGPDEAPAIMVPGVVQAAATASRQPNARQEEGAGLPPWDETWVVQPDRTVVAPPNAHPQALQELWQVAELESNQGASIFRVTPASMAAALNRGLSPEQIKRLLKRRSKAPIPATVERLIADQGEHYGRIRLGAAQTYVQTDDPALLDELLESRKLAELRWQRLAPTIAVIDNSGAPAALQALRRAGYLPVLEPSDGRSPSPNGSGTSPSNKEYYRELIATVQAIAETALAIEIQWRAGSRLRKARVLPTEVIGRKLLACREDNFDDVEIPLDAVIDYRVLVDDED